MGNIKNQRKRKKQQKYLVALSAILLLILVVIVGIIFLGKGSNKGETEKVESQVTQETENLDGTEKPDETEKIEETEVTEIVTEPQVEDFTMFFTGDVMLQYCKGIYADKGINGLITEYIQQEMVSADMTVINNEFPFSTRGEKAPDKQYTFRVEPSYVNALLDMGVDVASLANNHALDFGPDALVDTFTTLDEAKIPYVGAGATKERAEEAIFVEAGGRKVGVLYGFIQLARLHTHHSSAYNLL